MSIESFLFKLHFVLFFCSGGDGDGHDSDEDEGFCFSLVYIRLTLEINNKDNDCFLFLLYFECIFYFKIIKTERLYNEDQITYEHEVFYFKMNTDLGGWAHEDKSYLINANEVLKELNKPKIKKVGRSRKVYIFDM